MAEPLYVYAIARPGVPAPLGDIGLGELPVRVVGGPRHVAVVSEAPERIRPDRRSLGAHQGVLAELLRRDADFLPVAFGEVSKTASDVQRLLGEHEAGIEEQLARVAGCFEMGVRLTWAVPDLTAFLVERTPSLRILRDQIFRPDREATHEEKMEIGRAYAAVLSRERESSSELLAEAVRGSSAEVRALDPKGPREAANVVCLVRRGERGSFESEVDRAAGLFDDSFELLLTGPFAPYNFVDLRLGA